MSPAVAAGPAADAMVRAPKVHGPSLTVGELRAFFADDHVHMLLVVDAGRLLGTAVRGDVPADAGTSEPALRFARTAGRTIAPDQPLATVHAAMLADGVRRMAVVDEGGTLLGLLCLKRDLSGFCSDADVAGRAGDRDGCP